MIGYVEGKVVEKNPAHAVIDVSGVGYSLSISLHTYTQLSDAVNARLYVEQVFVRDANPKSFGFFVPTRWIRKFEFFEYHA